MQSLSDDGIRFVLSVAFGTKCPPPVDVVVRGEPGTEMEKAQVIYCYPVQYAERP